MSHTALSADQIINVMHCSECKNPLAVDTQGGLYCTHCKFPPSMQDTYIQYTCRCGGKLRGNAEKTQLVCTVCQLAYANK